MTVMPSTAEVADKAVSTEDAASGAEAVRLEAVLAALVETKVEAMKASSAMSRRSGSAPSSPRRLRLTSSSTASSSQNQHHHHHHHHHYHQHDHNTQQQSHRDHHYHQHHQHQHYRHDNKKKRDGHYHRRHDSAPCGEFIEDPNSHHKHRPDKEKRRASEHPPRSPRKRRRHSRSPHAMQGVEREAQLGLETTDLELPGIDGDQELALINFERAREAFSASCEPRLNRSACCFSQSAAQLKIHYDEDDYLALNLEDELEEEESLSSPDKRIDIAERYHRPRRKRKRRRRRVESDVPEEELADPEELPPRARWTIVATACLLLAMSLLLVGVTLRMAPIIDDMGDGRRASVSRKGKPRRASNARRKDSVRPARTSVGGNKAPVRNIMKDPAAVQQARRHRRIAMIVLGTFAFLVIASVLVVVVTLTHSSFHSPPIGSKDLAEHRAQSNSVRKENEELLNSLNRESTEPGNATAPP